jgi:pyruvate dehydrogenase E2 component (dihydrolipoamide acetyltransferase)
VAKEQVTVPDIGGAEGAEVIELLVAVGDEVEMDQGLIVLESDKASMEIPSTVAGTVVELLVTEGQELAEGAPVAVIEAASGAADTEESAGGGSAPEPSDGPVSAEPTAGDESAETADQEGRGEGAGESDAATDKEAAPTKPAGARESPPSPKSPDRGKAGGVYAGPAVRKLAREFGIDLERVSGSGPRGRIVKEDLHQFVQRSLGGQGSAAVASSGAGIPAVPEVDFTAFGEVEVIERSKLDKLTAVNMQRSWLNLPHVTQFDEADITELETFRSSLKSEAEERGTKLTPMPFLLKACAVALRDNPKFSSSLVNGGEGLAQKRYCHIGLAVDTPAGLLVPVIRDVDRKTIWELADEVVLMAGKARDRKLSPTEMQGGCFTISSLGNIGGNGFTPIVNAPEVGILGVSRAQVKPVWDGSEFQPRKLLPLSLSYDHRVINGGDAGRFLTRLVALLGDIRQLVM